MHQPNRSLHLIEEINRAAICDVNAKANARLIGDQAITTFKTFVPGHRRIDNGDVISMHLPRGHERRGRESMPAADFPMNTIEAGERFCFVMRHADARNPQGESVRNSR